MTRFAVRTLLNPSGERLPILLHRSTGMPIFYPNLYAITVLRQTNRASATIERSLREISILLDFLAIENIDLSGRMRSGSLLTLGEIDGLARNCRQSVMPLKGREFTGSELLRLGDEHSLTSKMVSHSTSANRLRTIHAYLSWRTVMFLYDNHQNDIARSRLEQSSANILSAIKAKIPAAKKRNILGARQGLSPGVLEQLLQAVNPTSQDNPWKSDFVRQRNELIVIWLLQLGLRRGELLNIKISDINFRKNEVLIARRADDPKDPRRIQPRVKTRDRVLPLTAELACLSNKYILSSRSQNPGSRRHGYLFVSNFNGEPMSLASLNKIFQVLRLKVPDLPDNLSAHMMRHTWNDNFSKKIDENRISYEKEAQMRSYLMGWSPTSLTAITYTKRFIEEAACRASLELQNKISGIKTNDK